MRPELLAREASHQPDQIGAGSLLQFKLDFGDRLDAPAGPDPALVEGKLHPALPHAQRDHRPSHIGLEHRFQRLLELARRKRRERGLPGEFEIGLVGADVVFPLVARDTSVAGVCLDSLNPLAAIAADPQGQAVLAQLELLGVEVDRDEFLAIGGAVGEFSQPRQPDGVAQRGWGCGQLEFSLSRHDGTGVLGQRPAARKVRGNRLRPQRLPFIPSRRPHRCAPADSRRRPARGKSPPHARRRASRP